MKEQWLSRGAYAALWTVRLTAVLASDHTDGMIAQVPCHVSPDFVVRTISSDSPKALEPTTCEDLVTGIVKHRFTTLPYGHHVITAGQQYPVG